MNKEELEQEIKIYELVIKSLQEAGEALEAQLAEADKPKLEHGDFGYQDKCPRIFCGIPEESTGIMYGKTGDPKSVFTKTEIKCKLGNIFDLLAGEPLTEFETECFHDSEDKLKVELFIGFSHFTFKDKNGAIALDANGLKGFINKLIRVYISAMKQGK